MRTLSSCFLVICLACGGVRAIRPFTDAYPYTAVYGLEDCLRVGLARNLVLQNLVIDVHHAEADIEIARGVYDSSVSALGQYEDSELPSSNVPVQGATKSLTFGGIVSKRFTSGTMFGFRANSSRIRFTEAMAQVNPLHISSLNIQMEHPLAGGGSTSDRARIQIAESTRDTVALQVLIQQDQIAAVIEDAFWSAFAARSLYLVHVSALERARELLATNRKRFNDGLVDETDILAAEAALATRDVDVLNLRNALSITEDRLRERMNLSPELWDRVQFRYPREEDLIVKKHNADVDGALEVAEQNRPEPFLLRASLKRAEQTIELRRDEERPNVSLTGQLGLGDTSDEWKNSLSPDKTLWGVGVRYETSLDRTLERSQLRQADLAAMKVKNQLNNTRRTIAWEIRTAVRDLEAAYERVAATRKAKGLQARKLDLELEKVDQGRSSTRIVIEYQDDLSFAEFSVIEAIALYHQAVIQMRLAQGTIVDKSQLYDAYRADMNGIAPGAASR